jgi:hypothetical protein
VLSTATYHCVDLQVQIEEKEAMFPGDLQVNWMFYSNTINYQPWLEYTNYFGSEPATQSLTLTTIPGGYLGSATCVDLWPLDDNTFEPNQEKITDEAPTLIFWVSGVDSAGSTVPNGGGLQDDGTTVLPIFSSTPQYKSQYTFIHEKATFSVQDVLLDDDPRVGDSMKMQIKIKNTGTMAGVAELVIKSVTDGGTPVVERTVSSAELDIAEVSDWIVVDLEPFAEQTTGMYYTITLNGSTDTLYDGSAAQWSDVFNVKVAEEEDSSSLVLIVVLLVVVIGVLGTLVLVLARRNSGGVSLLDDEYEDMDDEVYADSGKVLAEIPANVDPEMARAMQAFPQWTQEEIQGYFDQGWNVESLKDWINNQ